MCSIGVDAGDGGVTAHESFKSGDVSSKEDPVMKIPGADDVASFTGFDKFVFEKPIDLSEVPLGEDS